MLVCSAMAVYVVALAAWGLTSSPADAALLEAPFSTTPLTRHLCLFSASFFAWDAIACALDGQAAAFHAHAWGCFLVFSLALRPLQQYMSMHVLLFEASTPFLHGRQALVRIGAGGGALYYALTAAFSVSFIAFRLVLVAPVLAAFVGRMLALARAEDVAPERVPAIFLMLALAGGLTCLNLFWGWQIIALWARAGADWWRGGQRPGGKSRRAADGRAGGGGGAGGAAALPAERKQQ